ncbi:hypothetical protein [uncultured Desulfosarcina sp.]|uniref:hypothetical protein n=1 Tax=uncultured Desulfosarcina sp. TaxID=218289 RepID=UPI0029C75702|nr:hypothetical protein [uncultured Desulfosarcina sp.]
MLHRKPHIESHLKSAEKLLAERHEVLTANGMDAEKIIKDSRIKQLKAEMRHAKKQLAAIAALETQMAEKAEARIRKETAAKSGELPDKPKKRDRNAPPAKKKKKRRTEMEEASV